MARSLLGDGAPYDYLHTFWSDQYEHGIEYVGHAARWDELIVRGSLAERRFIGFCVRDGAVKAAVGLNRGGDPELDEDGELFACKQLIATQAPLSPATLADDTVDLRGLAAQLGSAR